MHNTHIRCIDSSCTLQAIVWSAVLIDDDIINDVYI